MFALSGLRLMSGWSLMGAGSFHNWTNVLARASVLVCNAFFLFLAWRYLCERFPSHDAELISQLCWSLKTCPSLIDQRYLSGVWTKAKECHRSAILGMQEALRGAQVTIHRISRPAPSLGCLECQRLIASSVPRALTFSGGCLQTAELDHCHC